MPRRLRTPDLESQLLALLAASPGGLKSPELGSQLRSHVSQPTLSRALTRLRARGRVVAVGEARARRYHLADGRIGMAEIRSRLLHASVARRLLAEPHLHEAARKRLGKLREVNPAGRVYHDRWAALLAEPMPKLLRVMAEDSAQAAALRRESPFTIFVPPKERTRIFRQFSRNAR